LNRRRFLAMTTASSSLILPSLDALALPHRSPVESTDFKLKILATNWGYAGNADQFCAAAKKAGYDGAEFWWPGTAKEQEELFAAIKKHSLDAGFLYGEWQKDPGQHLTGFKKVIDEIAANRFQRPLYINCHSGKDHFSYEQNKLFIDYTTAKTKETGIPIYHETHRGRMMFAANITRQFMDKIPELRLTFDVSHWCNVHESMLDDQEETIRLAIERSEHIHARIGHPEGPQVNDPRAPEWEAVVKQHFAWWDKIVDRKKREGKLMTILTEFGPADYMPVLPYTRQPVADQWAINVHMMQVLRKRYS
jgi:sugar phosphate isomerase/epimerase